MSGGRAQCDKDLWLVLSAKIITFSFLEYSSYCSTRSSKLCICLSIASIVSSSLVTKDNICDILRLELPRSSVFSLIYSIDFLILSSVDVCGVLSLIISTLKHDF